MPTITPVDILTRLQDTLRANYEELLKDAGFIHSQIQALDAVAQEYQAAVAQDQAERLHQAQHASTPEWVKQQQFAQQPNGSTRSQAQCHQQTPYQYPTN